MEQAVLDHYATVSFSDEFKAAVRARLDEALLTTWGALRTCESDWKRGWRRSTPGRATCSIWQQTASYRRRRSEEKLIAIRDERAGIRRDIERLDAELETGRQVFLLALDLLDQPQELYRQAGPALRKIMNQTIFTKLKLDGATVTADELAEPFDVIVPAGRAYDDPTYHRKRPPALERGGLPRGCLGR